MEILLLIVILIFSVVIHEVSHGYAAERLGDPTARLQGRLTLNPIKHLDLFGSFIVPFLFYTFAGFILGWAKPVPYNPYNLKNQRWGEAMVAGAGPLSNIILALIFGLIIRLNVALGFLPETFTEIVGFVVIINIILALFNLIPIPPLDGSKILFSILPYRFAHYRQTLERYGFFVIIIFIFVLWPLVFPIIPWLFSLITGIGLPSL